VDDLAPRTQASGTPPATGAGAAPAPAGTGSGSAGAAPGSPSPAPSTVSRRDVGFRSQRGPILIALMLSTGLVAIDSTVVATAVHSIVNDLGGLTQFPWLFSVYLLAQAVSVPIYGKLADLIGRKPLMLLGIGLFLLGSICGGLAWNMTVLIVFRAVQGLGAGAVQPLAMTIAGDIYTVAERAAVTGYLSSVWGISAVLGPSIGGFFSEYVSWRWIFFVNIPLCLMAAWMLMRSFREEVVRRRHTIDVTGAVLLTGGCTLVILAVLEGGQTWPWASVAGVSVPAVGAAMLVAFVLVELRVAEPVLPLWVFRRRVLLSSSMAALCVGAVTLGLTGYLPTFVQGSLGTGALVAGFTLAPLSLGWPLMSAQAGRIYLRFGFRVTAVLGATVVVGGMLGMLTLDQHSPVWAVAVLCFVVGCGMGLVASPTLIAAQASVGWGQRGVVTGNNMFNRSIGSSVGVAVFGAVANATLGRVDGDPSPTELAQATHHVLLAVVVVTVGMLVATLALPGGRDTSQVTD
jgi:EmrB/QacA subfamily drug resistance transporter